MIDGNAPEMRPTPAGLRVHGALVAVQMMFASLGVAMKILLRGVPPTGAIAARMTLATIVFVVAWLIDGAQRPEPRDLVRLAIYAFFGLIANQLLFVEGLARTTATNAVVIGASIPVFTVGVAVLMRRERATPRKFFGLGVALAGALLLTGIARFRGEGAWIGNALVVANSLSYAIYLVISRDLLTRYRTLTVVAFTFLFGCVGVLPFGARHFVAAAPTLQFQHIEALSYIVLFPTVGTYFLTAFALARVPSSLVAIYIYLQPVVGALLAWAILAERPGIETLLAAALIFVGIWMVSRESYRAEGRQASMKKVNPN
jgi:drug/metabolite transporter (DMT)-like permease